MTIGIPVSGCDLGQSGISRYLIELLRGLAALPGDEQYILIGSEAALTVFDPGHPRFGRLVIAERWTKPLPNLLWNALSLPSVAAKAGLDALFFPAANRRLPARSSLPVVGTVHDLSSLHMKGKYPLSHELYIHHIVPSLIRKLDGVIAVSGATRDDLVQTVGLRAQDIEVIHHGVDLVRFSPSAAQAGSQAAAQRFGLQQPYLLYVSRLEHPGKNHVRLIQAFGDFKQKSGAPHQLVLAGSDWDRAEVVHQAADGSPWKSAIKFTGFVPDEALAGLYGGAAVYIFPSLYEGFGMPILEAMACGLPVFCSDCSSLPEVGGSAAAYFNPEDVSSIAEALMKTLDSQRMQTMRQAGLEHAGAAGWNTTAARTLAVLRRFCQGRPV
jgi:glycosyltransferase involved in cell wall biosynthesis